jgi:4-aminobutyrate aminotransferase-like enzyme
VLAPHEANAIATAARECGLLVGTAGGNTLRFAPPLVISEAEIARAVTLLQVAIDLLSGS